MVIEQHALEQIAKFIDEQIATADVRIGNSNHNTGLRRSILDGKVIRKHIYLTQEDPVGTVTRARLIGKDGKVWAQRTDPRVHEKGKGLLLEFKFTIKEGEV